ncbi:MAG: cytochrome c oxidase subunit 3 [Proteobacteria bacterium]|jgi:cytochrome c oxidase subunit 3|nr:cytochrome c oxidase subunit 3 [Pseudomonadota bacterium]HJP08061.1 cytochrome c oxidase subunit 3 [Arenicellales bacterium]|tara:strand:+ start:797 stop:1675 length:879 start_codon:yes stop_codon:yes gene_type:complete
MSAAHGGYYLPDPTKWPTITSMGLFLLALGFIMQLHHLSPGPWLMGAGALIIVLMIYSWFSQVATESEAGRYDNQVDTSFRMGMGWFIFSEVMFFAAFFGALFYTRILSVPWLAGEEMLWPGFEAAWPTAGPSGATYVGPDAHEVVSGQFSSIGAFGVPLLNTVLLLTSSVTVTIAHWALKKNQRGKLNFWLFVSVILGFAFMYFQIGEYQEAYTHLGLTLGSGVYGATFFMLTGFHGFHVTIGAITLTVILVRCLRGHFKPDDHFGFEGAAWYWHFVDTVWVGLFIFVYIL